MDDQERQHQAARIEALVEAIEASEDAALRDTTLELLQALLQFYGEGLARMMTLIAERDGAVPHVLAQDALIAPLLLLHGLHPLPVERRVALALEDVRPYLRSYGGDAELVSLQGGVARVRLYESSRGSPSSLERTVEDAMQQAAPDLNGIVVERVTALPMVP